MRPPPPEGRSTKPTRRDAAEDDWETWKLLTDTIGNRLSGSPQLTKAIDWAVAEMKKDGLENVHTEAVMVPHWVRGDERLDLRLDGIGELEAVRPEQLDAVVVVGVVRGRDHDADIGAHGARQEAHAGRRDRAEQQHVDADRQEAGAQRLLDHHAQVRVVDHHVAAARGDAQLVVNVHFGQHGQAVADLVHALHLALHRFARQLHLARFQRTVQGAEHSTGGCGDDVVDRQR